ncbi:MAG: hypothetical protein ACQES0_11300 [Bacteroidota bacterium]
MKTRALLISVIFATLLVGMSACDKEYDIYTEDDYQPDNTSYDEPDFDSIIDIDNYFTNSVYLQDFAFDIENRLWAATNRGVILLDTTSHTVFNTQNSPLTDNDVNFISIDDQSRVWMCLDNALFMYEINSQIWHEYTSDDVEYILSGSSKVYTKRPGHQYLMCFQYLYEFDGNNWQLVVNLNELFDEYISMIQTDAPCAFHDSVMWINSYEGLIALHNDSTAQIFNTANSGISDNSLVEVHTDDDGNVWMTNDSGIEMYDGESWQVFSDKYRLSVMGNTVLCYYDEFVFKWVSNQWWQTDVGNNQFAGSYNAGVADQNDTIWLSAGDRLYKTSLQAE